MKHFLLAKCHYSHGPCYIYLLDPKIISYKFFFELSTLIASCCFCTGMEPKRQHSSSQGKAKYNAETSRNEVRRKT